MSDISHLLQAIENGNSSASEELLPLVYDELRRLAASKMAHEPAGQTLQPTALVHEAFMRLVDKKTPQRWTSKRHFFAAAAEAMRRILIERARAKKSQKRGGDRRRIDLDHVDLTDPNDCNFLISLDRALNELDKENSEIAQVVNLRFFAGLTIEETANATGFSVRTVNRYMTYAKAWLYQKISRDTDVGP